MLRTCRPPPRDDLLMQLEHPRQQMMRRPGLAAELEKRAIFAVWTPCCGAGCDRHAVAGKAGEIIHDRFAQRALTRLVRRPGPKLRPAVRGADAPECVGQLAPMKGLET